MNPARSPAPPPAGPGTPDDAVADLLHLVQQRFYPPNDDANPSHFFQDRRRLIYALSWPAVWLEHRGLTCSPARYRCLVTERLEAIACHGDPSRYGAYFPTYLLKCLQDWFRHHGDELYAELKHLRNTLDQILASPVLAATARRDAQQIETLAAAHRLLQPSGSRSRRAETHQLTLF
jgi:hypothetical protein